MQEFAAKIFMKRSEIKEAQILPKILFRELGGRLDDYGWKALKWMKTK